MSKKIRIKLKDSSLMGISSSKEAFISSKITDMWQDAEKVYENVRTAVKRDEFYSILDLFNSRGAIDKVVESVVNIDRSQFSLSGHEDVRDYGNIRFDERELCDVPELPLNLKKEILFLFYYGKSLDLYKIVNISNGLESSDKDVEFACAKYRKMFAVRNFEGIELGSYGKKLEKVREILRRAYQLEDPGIRKDYDLYLKANTEKASGSRKPLKQDRESSLEDTAFEHFLSAMKYLAENDIEKAYRDIQVSLHVDPSNEEYLKLKEEVDNAVKEMKVNVLMDAIENDDSLIMDETKLEKAINRVLQLTDSSPLMMIKIAESALEKEMPEMVIEYASKAAKIDKDLEEKAQSLIKKAGQMKSEFSISPEKEKVFHIK